MHPDIGNLVKSGPGAQRSHHCRRCDAAGFDIGGDADAAQFALGRSCRTARLETAVVGHLQCRVQRRGVVAAVVLQRNRRLIRKGVGRDEVLAPQLDLVDAGILGNGIDQPFHQERGFRPSGATIGVHRHGVGEHRFHLHVDRRGLINTGQQRGIQVGRHRRRERRQVGAHVAQRVHPHRQEMALGVDRHFSPAVMVTAMRVGHEAFGALGGPFDRAAHLGGGPGDDGFLGVVIDLGAEAAADIGGHHAQLVLGDVQHEGAH